MLRNQLETLMTVAMLVFVLLCVKPYNDDEGDAPSEEVMTSADRKQAWSLYSTESLYMYESTSVQCTLRIQRSPAGCHAGTTVSIGY